MTGDSEEKKGHTPGPWKLGSRVGEKNCFVEINGSGWVALATVPVRLNVGEFDLPEGVANARLIAAAPALLAALQAIVWGDGYDIEGPDGMNLTRARAAISLATQDPAQGKGE